MNITNTLLPPHASDRMLMIFDVLVDDRSMFVGLGLGELRDGDWLLNPSAQECLTRLARHSGEVAPSGGLRLVEMKHFPGLSRRFGEVMSEAQQGEAMFFVCGSGLIYDAVFEHLHMSPRVSDAIGLFRTGEQPNGERAHPEATNQDEGEAFTLAPGQLGAMRRREAAARSRSAPACHGASRRSFPDQRQHPLDRQGRATPAANAADFRRSRSEIEAANRNRLHITRAPPNVCCVAGACPILLTSFGDR